jgi:hypothetical protein
MMIVTDDDDDDDMMVMMMMMMMMIRGSVWLINIRVLEYTARHLTGTGASAGLHACTDCRGDSRA